jgi:hypothetical protein
MKMYTDPFPVDVINFEEKKILVRSDQAESTRGKNVVVSDQLRTCMMKPKNLEIGVWKENLPRKPRRKWKPIRGGGHPGVRAGMAYCLHHGTNQASYWDTRGHVGD